MYSKFAYDGISVRTLDNIRSVSGYQNQPVVHFSTLLKVANSSKEAVIIDRVDAPKEVNVPECKLTFQRIEVKLFALNEDVVLPPSNPLVILRPGGYVDRRSDLQPVFQVPQPISNAVHGPIGVVVTVRTRLKSGLPMSHGGEPSLYA